MSAEQSGHVAIAHVLLSYARALDERDWALLGRCFTEDGVTDYGELAGVHTGTESIVTACRDALGGLDATQHLVTNIEVDVVDEHAADARCSFQAQHVLDGSRLFTVGGTYLDHLVCQDGRWLIQHRRMRVVWTSGEAAVLPDAQARGQAPTAV